MVIEGLPLSGHITVGEAGGVAPTQADPLVPWFGDWSFQVGFPAVDNYSHYNGPLVTDFDGDGLDDLVLNYHGDPGVSLWRQNKNRTFSFIFKASKWIDSHGLAVHTFDGNRSIK
eukprot:CAMPEP_0184687366 /NCGR_PEP_ID=MMETSP0312-20130426/26069_1 /TAXON_ID=31354 /ORGANISM="Compsopogon coeruleus, Strain SAG 36.94" /LENGTH=114 /DNA_ID=CAMNT_0027143405 /DNA_START=175 /DNA_END=516 /DNA_ORIENTATION=-